MPEFGLIGLGKMGGGLALQALEKGLRVVGYDTGPVPDNLRAAGLDEAGDLGALCTKLKSPRIIFLYVPAAPVVDSVINDLADHLAPGDIVVDGGNSYWGDSLRRHIRLRERRCDRRAPRSLLLGGRRD